MGIMRRRRGEVSLARALSKLGLASRTEATRLIHDGSVAVDGAVVRDPDRRVVPETATITIGGTRRSRQAPLTLLLHKPRGVVTTRSDPHGRATVYDVIGELPRYVAPVGRLDLASSGLLLLTNDTRFADWALDPLNAVPREYVVTMRGELSDEDAERALGGVRVDDELLRATRVEILKRSRRETHVRVELVEGRNRELRRLFKAAGHEVTRLKRIRFGGLSLGTLAPGKWRELSPEELQRAFPNAPIRRPTEKG